MRKLVFLLLLVMLLPLQAMALDEMSYTPQGTTFKVATLAGAKAVKLRLYRDGMGGKAVKTVSLKATPDGRYATWTATVKGDLKGMFYTFDVQYGKKYQGETPGFNAKAVGAP